MSALHHAMFIGAKWTPPSVTISPKSWFLRQYEGSGAHTFAPEATVAITPTGLFVPTSYLWEIASTTGGSGSWSLSSTTNATTTISVSGVVFGGSATAYLKVTVVLEPIGGGGGVAYESATSSAVLINAFNVPGGNPPGGDDPTNVP